MRTLCLILLPTLFSCTSKRGDGQFRDGGLFVWPDSGYVFDAGRRLSDGPITDTGPHLCAPACATGEVCACLLSGASNCGCHPPQDYQQRCDPQVPRSCKDDFSCVKARVVSGTVYLCSDGRPGTPCSKTQASCNSSGGCVCLATPFGVACQCQGANNIDPFLCDPQVPISCPNGTCVQVDAPSGAYFMCSDGTENQPCEIGDSSCITSLGCTCPFQQSRRVCRCSEPGMAAGDLCDPSVVGSCVDGFNCETRGDAIEEGFTSECVPADWMMSGEEDPFACDPNRPLCPPGFDCEEVEQGTFRCRHRF
jgi:hypothetical protein